jgi:hypothetical protein
MTTARPFTAGVSISARAQVKACRVSVCQLTLKSSQLSAVNGPMTGAAPALRTTYRGW